MCFNVVKRHETAGNYRLSSQIYSIYAIQTSALPLKIVNSRFFCQKKIPMHPKVHREKAYGLNKRRIKAHLHNQELSFG